MRTLIRLNAIAVLSGLLGVAMVACSTAGDSMAPSEDRSELATEAVGGCNQCDNCVYYARCRQPALPYGLTTYEAKLRIINSHSPTPGAVAIINTGSQWGHVAYVESVNGGEITISEGNWPYGHCGQRTGTPDHLRVQGYFVP